MNDKTLINNTLSAVVNFGKSLVIGVAIVLTTGVTTATAQNFRAINGLFSPTAADRFFEAGRKDFEREARFLTNSDKYFNEDLLKLDPEVIEQIKENQLSNYIDSHEYLLEKDESINK